jgi:Fic family protein
LICEVHRLVTDSTLSHSQASGRFQQPGEDRVISYDNENQLLHVPPPAEELPDRIQRLCDFANGALDDTYVSAVVRAIVVHFMLAYDHPFEDGNGRTARAIFYWSMLSQGYWLTEFLSISRILSAAPSQYARSFLYVSPDENDLTDFIIYQLKVLQRAIRDLKLYLESKMRELREVRRMLAVMSVDFNDRQMALIEHAVKHPDAHYTVVSHRNSHNVIPQTARQDLLDLEQRGLLVRRKVGKAFVWSPVDRLAEKLGGGPVGQDRDTGDAVESVGLPAEGRSSPRSPVSS